MQKTLTLALHVFVRSLMFTHDYNVILYVGLIMLDDEAAR